MEERCERCGGRVAATWRKPGTHLTLPMCVTHNNEHGLKLAEQGWLQQRVARR